MLEKDCLLLQSSRIAVASLLHDLGKFAERARIEVPREQIETWKQLDCPHWDGRPTHIHAAYTTAGFLAIESHLPQRADLMAAPFAMIGNPDADDSLINAAARHHRPETFLQWVIATADRLASGFERQAFDQYNKAQERTSTGRNHYQARLLSLFDSIGLDGARRDAHEWCVPLRPLAPLAMFPHKRKDHEPSDDAMAQAEYRSLWQAFLKGMESLPANHRPNLPLWLDHFDAAWLAYTHSIPSATAGNTRPEVSLYDHSKAVAALAVAIWRWHEDRKQTDVDSVPAMKDRTDWDAPKFLMIQGDFSGIQDFIFAEGGQTQRQAAKILRGRSFQVSLLSELAALAVLEALALPPTSQIVNAAGKFLIVAPNTAEARTVVGDVQAQLDTWFLEQTFGEGSITLAIQEASCNDFLAGRFADLMACLFETLEAAKLRRFNLVGEGAPSPIRQTTYPQGTCAFDGRRPAATTVDGKPASDLASDQVRIGRLLADSRFNRLLVLRPGETLHASHDVRMLDLEYFGYRVALVPDEDMVGRFGNLAATGTLVRCWDYSLPAAGDAPLFQGYARRDINAWVPRFDAARMEWEGSKYGSEETGFDREAPIKTLGHLAHEDRLPRDDGLNDWFGSVALGVLKGDVDNLGSLFQRGIQPATFAKMAALSRQMNAFFAIHLPWLCRSQAAFSDTYTVFAGGDDFFLIGPWHKTQRLARRMADDFGQYVAHNPEIHFSAGYILSKPGLPVRALGHQAEDALATAKTGGKNAIVCHGVRVGWQQYARLAELEAWFEERRSQFSTGFVYRLLHLAEMAASRRPEDAIWQSWLAYRVRRFVVDRMKIEGEQGRGRAQEEIAGRLRHEISAGKLAVRIPVANHLYRFRD